MSNPQVVHSKLSFSSRKRWRLCPISVKLSEGMPDSSEPAAAEGTCAHDVAEFYVRQYFALAVKHPGRAPLEQTPPEGLDLSSYGATPEERAAAWNAELRKYGERYRDFVVSLIPAGARAYVDVEKQVSIPSIHGQLFGTLDLCLWLPETRHLFIVDYKYGRQAVEVGTADDPNAQLSAYAVAAIESFELDPARITLAVYQPRVPLGEPEKPLELSADWLGAERRKLQNEVAAVENPGAPRPGDHCRYCKGASKCPTVHNAAATAMQSFGGHASLLAMSDDELVQLWAAKTAFKNFWEDVEERIEKLVQRGHGALYVEEKQGRRMWADPGAAALTFVAMGRLDLLQPIALSDALEHIPEDLQAELVSRSRPSRSIKTLVEPSANVVADIFKKYAKSA